MNRCLHVIKTCCKENYQKENSPNFLLPIGSAWKEALLFIQKHINQLDIIKLSLISFLIDWHYRLLLQYKTIEKEELEAVKVIILHYIKEIEDGQEFWQEENAQSKSKNLITILFDLAEISKEEIKQLVARAINKENRSFYRIVIEKCLSGIDNERLIKELPELIVEIAWKNWKYIPPKKTDSPDEIRFMGRRSLRDEECWGIRDKQSFFPSGIYKTPIHSLLHFHTDIGLKFIIDFINYSVEFYVKADYEYKHQISQIEIELNDGTVLTKWAAWELWATYRALSGTSYALESLLMSLEKFLLETAIKKTDISKNNLKLIFDYILKNSNNIAPLAVLTSVSIAYPEEIEEAMLPLLSVREFYEWDLCRATKESISLELSDNRIPFAQKERWKSNQLPHRKKYRRGLRDFLFYYQIKVGTLNEQIHQILDKLKTHLPKDDVVWKKNLIEMDIRNHKLGNYDEKIGGHPILPIYDEDVTVFMESNKESFEAEAKSMNFFGQLTRAYEKKEIIDFSIWLSCYKQYSSSKTLNILFDQPVTLAVLGLRDFTTNLNKTQKKWCLKTILNAIGSIIQDPFNRNFNFNQNYNLLEKEIVFSSFHLLMQNVKNEEDKNEIIALMIYILYIIESHEVDKITEYVRETFFAHYPNEAKRVWLGLIKYSFYKKANPHFNNYHDENRLKIEEKNEEKFLQEISSNKNLEIELSEINLEKCEGDLLTRAFIIMPCNAADKDFESFIKHFIPLLIADLQQEKNYSYNRNRQGRQIHFESVFGAELYLAEFLLKTNTKLAKSALDLIIDPIYQLKLSNVGERNDLFEFSSKIPEYVIHKLDGIIATSNDKELNKKLIENFWTLWQHFFDKIKTSGKQYFLSTLFLDISWKETASHWMPLENKRESYQSMVKDLGKYKAISILNVFSTIGEKTFLPESISWLVEIFKSDATTTVALLYPSAERMIKRLFYNHISKIKNDKSLIDDYIWILNRMVDFGSSEAYLFRENVITYKSISN